MSVSYKGGTPPLFVAEGCKGGIIGEIFWGQGITDGYPAIILAGDHGWLAARRFSPSALSESGERIRRDARTPLRRKTAPSASRLLPDPACAPGLGDIRSEAFCNVPSTGPTPVARSARRSFSPTRCRTEARVAQAIPVSILRRRHCDLT